MGREKRLRDKILAAGMAHARKETKLLDHRGIAGLALHRAPWIIRVPGPDGYTHSQYFDFSHSQDLFPADYIVQLQSASRLPRDTHPGLVQRQPRLQYRRNPGHTDCGIRKQRGLYRDDHPAERIQWRGGS